MKYIAWIYPHTHRTSRGKWKFSSRSPTRNITMPVVTVTVPGVDPIYWYGGFLKWWYPKMDGLYMETLLKWMIWGYHHLGKHPYIIAPFPAAEWRESRGMLELRGQNGLLEGSCVETCGMPSSHSASWRVFLRMNMPERWENVVLHLLGSILHFFGGEENVFFFNQV